MAQRWFQKLVIFQLSGVFYAFPGKAGDLLPPNVALPGVRAKGLGVPPVALTGVAQGESSLHNPSWVGVETKAAQKRVLRGLYFPAVTLGANGTTRALGRAYFGGQGSTQTSIEDFLKAAQNAQTPFGMFEIFPSVTLWRAQWGLFARAHVEGFVWQPEATAVSSGQVLTADDGVGRISRDAFFLESPSSKINVSALLERGGSLSVSTPYKDTGLSLGLTFRPTWRSEYSGDVELADPLVSESAKNLQAKFNETRGFPVSLGLHMRFPRLALKPSVGLKLDDVGDTHYRAVSSSHQPLIQKSNLSAGVAAWMFQDKLLSSQCTLSGHHLNDGRVAKSRSIGAGCEILVQGQIEGDIVSGAPFILRFGGTQDGFSYGVSWDTTFAIVEMASTVAQVNGPTGFLPRADRRYFMRITVDANQP